MVLRITVINATHLREAVQAVLAAGPTLAILSWDNYYLAVHSRQRNPYASLRIYRHSFESYDFTDQSFNAVLEVAQVREIFNTADNSDVIEFSHILEDNNGLNGHGFLRVHFNKAIGDNKETLLRTHHVFPEDILKKSDPYSFQLPLLARFNAMAFARSISTFNDGAAVYFTFEKDKVLISADGSPSSPVVAVHGLIHSFLNKPN